MLNVVTADREVSELLVRDPRVDKITFTGSTAAGRIASLCGERIARCTLELGGKSAAVILDDMDLGTAAQTLDRVEGYIAKGVADGATLATGGGRPKDLERGWFVEPTVFGNVSNSSVIAQEEIFGPVLSVIPADNEQDAIRVANDTIYGLNASVFTNDVDRCQVAGQLRSGTVGHNAFRTDSGIAFGGFKQSGIGREGGEEGLRHFLEVKTVILEGTPAAYDAG